MIQQRDILCWEGEPVLIECTEGPPDPSGRPRSVYMLTFEPPEQFAAMVHEQMVEQGREYVEAMLEAGAELAEDVDPDNLDELLAEFVGENIMTARMGVAEPFELCFN